MGPTTRSRRRRIHPAGWMVAIVSSLLRRRRTSSSTRRALMVVLIVIDIIFSSFNNADPSYTMLVDCCMLYCRECGPIAAVWRDRPPWLISSIAFYPILPSYFTAFYLGTHATSPPNPCPTTCQPPIPPNISANIQRMRTFEVTILCACIVGSRLCRMVAHTYC